MRHHLMTTSATIFRSPDEPAAPTPVAQAPANTPPAQDDPNAPVDPDKPTEETPKEPPKDPVPPAPVTEPAPDPKPKDGPAYTLQLPGDVKLDTEALAKATPIFQELGLDEAGAQKVVDLYAKDILPVVVPQVQAQVLDDFGLTGFHQWEAQVREDPRLGGAEGKPISPEKLAEVQSHVAKFRDTFGTPELTALLEATTLGNHPEIVHAFYKAGQALAEGSFHRTDTGAQGDIPLSQALYGDAFAPRPKN